MNSRVSLINRGGVVLALAAAIIIGPTLARGDEPKAPTVDKSLDGLKFGILACIDYSEGDTPLPDGEVQHYNQFGLTRGYFTVEKKFSSRVGARMTMDLSQDREDKIKIDDSGANEEYKVTDDLEGSYVMRLKYLYAAFSPDDLGPFTQMKAEAGMGHMPWLDFEESINLYRCQGTMAVERAGVFNSADLGVSLAGNLGGRLEDAQAKTGNARYDGRFGSWHFGVYNGGGYHATEKNQNKVVEGRITLRPLPDFAPGMQLSYFYLTGQGNTSTEHKKDTYWPYYEAQIGMLSFESPNVVVTGQYQAGRGNAKGDWVYHDKRDALAWTGWSAFLNLRRDKLGVFGRYDWFDIDAQDELIEDGEGAYGLLIYGLSYAPLPGHLIVLAAENIDYQEDAGGRGKLPVMTNDLGDERKFQVVYQVKL